MLDIAYNRLFCVAARTAEITGRAQYLWRTRLGRWRSGPVAPKRARNATEVYP